MKAIIITGAIACAVVFGAYTALGYVAVHFIQKFW